MGIVEQCYLKHGLNKDEYEGIKTKRITHIENLITEGTLDTNLRWHIKWLT